MRKLFLAATGLFWLAIMAFASAGLRAGPGSTAPDAAPASNTPGTLAAASAERRIALSEVARHATETDCWMAIQGVVYDITSYLPDHPSRPSVILPWCGKDASDAYKTKTKGRSHTPEADGLLPRYRIGVLIER